ncbi:DUF1579 domain-containing protein [Rhodopirellula sp. SWK7]|uniref:DUF1579 domain-containing protein n=1 Tax=Rhodopirellula sp. SWK7 TaxID=595460 RepID=UPI0002C01356|nr:DUF1579 domain-containing protein [Rhodopirellula sp. SWK7]EMI41373.1 protein containing DUF1579 [Rhodopirellula sp. SWK7]
MFSKPQAEHQWLEQMIGDWSFDHQCMGPDNESTHSSGKMACRTMGGLWLICESSGGTNDEDKWSSIMTLGFDPTKNRYVGTFVGSMMANIWHYRGTVDESGKRLPLDSEGPKFGGTGTCLYRDTIEIVDANEWLMTSEMQDDDGAWAKFMHGKHTRI